MKCEIIQDLLPSYVDGLTCEVSNQEIEKHMVECAECRNCYEAMKSSVDTSKVVLEENEFMKVLKRIRKINIEKTVLISAGIVCLLVMLAYWGYRYMYGLTSVLPEEVNIVCQSDGNKREIIFEPNEEKWHIIWGYSSELIKGDTGDKPLFTLSALKSRAWMGYQGETTNVFRLEFIDDNTIALSVGQSMGKIDFEQNDYFFIDFSGEMVKVYIRDIYNNNFESFTE